MTLDQRIRGELEQKIRAGDWPPGHRIPTERELMEQYGCARMTVGKAIGALVAAGLIERRKKAGSFVARPHVRTAVLEIPDIAATIRGRGEAYRFELRLRRELAAPQAAAEFDAEFDASGPQLLIAGLHVADERPFAHEHRIIGLEAAPAARAADFHTSSPGAWLLENVPWTLARHRITARLAAGLARELDVARADPCLQVERWTWRQGEPVTYVRQVFPADRYDLIADFAPRDRAANGA